MGLTNFLVYAQDLEAVLNFIDNVKKLGQLVKGSTSEDVAILEAWHTETKAGLASKTDLADKLAYALSQVEVLVKNDSGVISSIVETAVSGITNVVALIKTLKENSASVSDATTVAATAETTADTAAAAAAA